MELTTTSNWYIITIPYSEASFLGIDGNHTRPYIFKRLLDIFNCILEMIGGRRMHEGYKFRVFKNDNGYNIFVSFQKRNSSFAVQFSKENELLTLTEQLYINRCSKLCISSIYVYDEKYYLVITPITKSIKPEMICREFSLNIIKDSVEILNIQRNGLRICSTDAIDKLGETICK